MSEEAKNVTPAVELPKAKLKAAEGSGINSLSIAGVQYDADETGVFSINGEHALLAVELFGLVAAPEAAKPGKK